MKALLFLSLLPSLALAAGPDYKIPRDATSQPETCFTTELARESSGATWSEWAPMVTTDRHQTTFWSDEETFYTLKEAADGRSAEFSSFTETLRDRSFTHRRKSVVKWKKLGSRWNREETSFDVTIQKTEGRPTRLTETGGVRSLIWDLRTYGDGDDQITERTLLNPSVLNGASRQVGSHVEHCRLHLPAGRR